MTDRHEALRALVHAVENARSTYLAADDGSVAESEAFIALENADDALAQHGEVSTIILSLLQDMDQAAAEIERLRGAIRDGVEQADWFAGFSASTASEKEVARIISAPLRAALSKASGEGV